MTQITIHERLICFLLLSISFSLFLSLSFYIYIFLYISIYIYIFAINRKEKWDQSGANEALARMTASIPQGTKEYISLTSQQLFDRKHLRSVTVVFGIGEERPFYLEKSPALLLARVKHNVGFFYLNYLLMTAVLFCLTLLISPSAIIGIGLLAMAWMYVIRRTSSGAITAYGM